MRKKNRIVFYIMLLLIFILVIYLIVNYITNYSHNNVTTNNNDDNNEKEKIDTNLAFYNKYIYTLPSNVHYDLQKGNEQDLLHIYSNDEKWGANIGLIEKDENQMELFKDYDRLENIVKNNIADRVENRKVYTRNEIEIVSFEAYNKISNNLLVYMPAYDNYEYIITLYDGDDKSMNYDALNKVIDILLTAKKAAE